MQIKIPTDYMLCQNEACPQKEHCLRHLCLEWISSECFSIRALNPKCYPAGKKCTFFRTDKKISLAWGIKNLLSELPYDSAKEIKKTLLAMFGRTKYYQFYREEKPLLPAEQKIIKRVFLKCGVKSEPVYSRFTEEYDWR